nr:SDR family NAD(P)-dependent oxidoreductase [Ardenticatenaceae bacterium]
KTTDVRPQTTDQTPVGARLAVPESPAAPAVDVITEKVRAIVAEQTGYPTDMLDLDLDLEADLGVDTVKQAETFLAIREAFDIPRQDDLQLRDYPTLEKVIGFVRDMRPDLKTTDVRPQTTDQTPVGARLAVPESPAAPAVDVITEKVRAIVADQTGYPTDMLDLDLDLEADLGVDTVKQAETFLAIREQFDIPRQENLQLRDYPTLEKVIGFVKEMRPDLVGPQHAAAADQKRPETIDESVEDETASVVLPVYAVEDADQMPRRVPTPTLRPALDLCKPTGITLNAGSRVILMPDEGGVGQALQGRLHKLGVEVLILEPNAIAEQITGWLNEGPIQGVYWLPALDVEPELSAMSQEEWQAETGRRIKGLYTAMRALYETLNTSSTFLVSATRLGGQHGYGSAGATAPLGGGVTGFTKAYKRERPETLVKAVDFPISRKTAALADKLIAETLHDPGLVEVGYVDERRVGITLIEKPLKANGGLTLNSKTVMLITGAAGGITSAIVGDLAAAGGGTFYLLDLTPEPDRNDPQIALFREDKEQLKRLLIDEAKAAGKRPTPVQIEKEMMAVERQEAALRSIEMVESIGGTAHYRSVNLLDHDAVAAVVDEIAKAHGRIDVIIHAGGIEISKGLDKKDPAQFDLVFDIKANGMYSLLHAAQDLPIGAIVAFSSVAGRFGNSGQTDYSAANDLLCKVCSSLRRWRPETRGIAIDWTAWGGIGMATRGSIPTIMKAAGIDMLPPEAGVPTVRRELLSPFSGEIVVGGALGILTEEFDEHGGVDLAQFAEKTAADQTPLLDKLTRWSLYGGMEIATALDPNEQPFLHDHAMDGTPLLPGVMGTEAFAELARFMVPELAEGSLTIGNETFHSPFKFYRMEPQTLFLRGQAIPDGEKGVRVHTALYSRRELPTGLQEKLHFTAEVLLSGDRLQPPTVEFKLPAELPIQPPAIYDVYFHGPAYQVLEGVAVNGAQAIGRLATELPPNINPAGALEQIAPRLIELCFQTAGVWEIKTNGVLALPMAIGQVQAYQPESAATGPLFAIVEAVTTDDGQAAFNAQVVDESGQVYIDLQRYRTVQLPGQVTL